MGKLIVTLICTATLLFFVYLFFGTRLNGNVYQSAHFSVSWFLVVGACIGYGVWRVVKGK